MTVSLAPLSIAQTVRRISDPHQAQRREGVRAICFSVNQCLLALPVSAIAKVTHCPPIQGSDLARVQLVHVDQQIVRILNLHALLADRTQSADLSDGQFLIIARSPSGELCGIPADLPPDLIEISRDAIRTLPQDVGDTPLARVSTAIALLPPAENPRTVFLLNLARAREQEQQH